MRKSVYVGGIVVTLVLMIVVAIAVILTNGAGDVRCSARAE